MTGSDCIRAKETVGLRGAEHFLELELATLEQAAAIRDWPHKVSGEGMEQAEEGGRDGTAGRREKERDSDRRNRNTGETN